MTSWKLPQCPACARRHDPQRACARNKYGARVVEIDGLRFDSKKEATRYLWLKERARRGEIRDLEVHPAFLLTVNGQKIGVYTADFRYREGDVLVIEDCKSAPTRTEAYRLRKRLMQAIHGVEIEEV